MSALPPKADIASLPRKSGQPHRSKKAPLFDHFVGRRLQRERHSEAECIRGLEVDHQLELRRLQHRHFCRVQHAVPANDPRLAPQNSLGFWKRGAQNRGKERHLVDASRQSGDELFQALVQ